MQPETVQERRERNQVSKNRIIYSLPVRIGNWYNDWVIKEDNRLIYNYRKDNGLLLAQKTKQMFDNLLSPTILEYDKPFLFYGKNYQIISVTNKPLYVSGLLSEKEIEASQNLCDCCLLTASPNSTPCIRNTFIIVDPDNEKREGHVNYGDDVYFKIINNNNEELYVQCENATFDNITQQLPLFLTKNPDIFCRFKINDWQVNFQFRTVGKPVRHNSCVILKHTASGRNLIIDLNRPILTFFGNEYKISCYTYRNCQIGENLWKITGQLVEDRTPKA